MPYCTSNRHRSVAMGTLVSAGLYVHGVNHFLGHMRANESWPRMRCGGHCAYCRGWFDHNRATELGTRVLAQLDPKITSYAKHPADDERARASRVPPPDPAAHTRTSASLGPLTPSGESSFTILGIFKAKYHAQQAAEGWYYWRADHADLCSLVCIRRCAATTTPGSDAGPVAAWTPSWATKTHWLWFWWRRGRQWRWWNSFQTITCTWKDS